MNFAGIIGIFIGGLISFTALEEGKYLWFIGSVPLIILGIYLQYAK